MKKTIVAFILLSALVLAPQSGIYAKNKTKINGNLKEPLEAKDLKIHKKKLITKSNKKIIDNLKKGKPATPPGKDKKKNNSEIEEIATGIIGDSVNGEKYAVVVGVCDYPGTANDICISDGDAQNMYNALLNVYEYKPGNVALLRDMNATYGNVLNAINLIYSRVNPDDEVTFFFSGHGTTAKVNDGDRERIDEGIVVHDGVNIQYIWDGQLKAWFSGINTSRVAFIFDICKAGGMDDVSEEGRVVIMSSQEKENSFVYSNGENGEGLFSRFFVNEGMLQGLADGYNQIEAMDGKIALEESFIYAKEVVSWFADNYLWHSQIPKMKDLFFNDMLL